MKPCCPHCGAQFARPTPAQIVAALKIDRQMRQIAEFLAMRFGTFVSRDRLCDLIYAEDPDGGPLNADSTVSVRICGLRRCLKRTALQIETEYKTGWRMTWRATEAGA